MSAQFKLNDKVSIDQTQLIGKGSTGNVFLGFSNQNNYQKYAIKAIDLNQVNNQVTRYLLSCEIVALTNISKDNPQHIVKLQDVILSKQCCYLVMQLLQGGPLSQFIKQHPNGIDQNNVIKIFAQLIEGYKQMKRHGIVHRDLKPDNIIFRKKNQASNKNELSYLKIAIIDFGYCTTDSVPNKPQVYYNVGSPKYMSPQAYKNNCYSQKSDIWALGIVLYEMLHGKTFDSGMEMTQYLHFIQSKGIPIHANVSQNTRILLNGMLAYDQKNRFNCQQIQRLMANMTIQNFKRVQSPQKINIYRQNQTPKQMRVNLIQSMILSQPNNPNQVPRYSVHPENINNQNPIYRRQQRFVRVLQNFSQQNTNGRKIVHLQSNSNNSNMKQGNDHLIRFDVIQEQRSEIQQNKERERNSFLPQLRNDYQGLRQNNNIYKSQFGQITQRKSFELQNKNVFFNSQVTKFIRPPSPLIQNQNSTKIIPSNFGNQKQNLLNFRQDKNLIKSYSTNNVQFAQNQSNKIYQQDIRNKQLPMNGMMMQINTQNPIFLRNTMPNFERLVQSNDKNINPNQLRQSNFNNPNRNTVNFQSNIVRTHQNGIPQIVQNEVIGVNNHHNGIISHLDNPFTIVKVSAPINMGPNLIINGQRSQQLVQNNPRIERRVIDNNNLHYNQFNGQQNNLTFQNRQKRNSFKEANLQNQQFIGNQKKNYFNFQSKQQNNIKRQGKIIVPQNNNNFIHIPQQHIMQAPIRAQLNNNGLYFSNQLRGHIINNNINNKMSQINRTYFNPDYQILERKLNTNSPVQNIGYQQNRNPMQFQNQRMPIINTVPFRPVNNFRQSMIINQRPF